MSVPAGPLSRAHSWEAQLQRDVLPWHAGLAERLRAEPRLWAHNDWHVSNLLWRDGQVSTVLDFGLASPTSALFDLATAIERNAVAWLELERGSEAVRLDIALALLGAIAGMLPLSAARVHLLADLLPMVHFDFALSEGGYFEGITGSTANADVASGLSCWAIRRGSIPPRAGTAAGPARRRVIRLGHRWGQIPFLRKGSDPGGALANPYHL